MRHHFREVRETRQERIERNLPPVFVNNAGSLAYLPDEIVDHDGVDDLPDEITMDDLNGFKKIKPEKKMTYEECDKFWDDFFNNLPDEIGEDYETKRQN